MEAAASPFPRDDTTPPVTKMYLTGLVWLFGIVVSDPLRARAGGEQLTHSIEIRRRVHADRIVAGFDHLD